MALENAAQKKARELSESLIENEVTEEETIETATEEVPAATATASKVKLVSIMGTEDHDCTIANVRYLIEHRKTQRVPEDVAMILQNSGIAIRTN